MTSSLSRRRFMARSAAIGGATAAAGLAGGIAVADTTSVATITTDPVFGPVTVLPADGRFPDVRTGANQRFVGTPDYVRLTGTTAQVVAAVQEAVTAGKRVAVRSGGHCYEDFVAGSDVKVVIDISEMNGISYDSTRQAFEVEAGARLGQVYDKLYKGWGVTVPGGACPSVGIGGHLPGGGYGALSRQYGLIVDYLYAVEVVIVDASGIARSVIATRNQGDPHRELWWAHTGGGGGNFGIATRYWLRSPDVTGTTSSTNPATLLPKPPSTVWISTVNWAWSSLSKAAFTQLMTNYGQWHEANSATNSPYCAMFSELKLPHQSGGSISLTVQMDASGANSQQMLDSYIAALGAGVGVAPVVVEERLVPWLHATQWGGFTGPDPTYRFKGKPGYQRRAFTAVQIDAMYRNLTRTDYFNPGALMLISAYGGQVNRWSSTDTAVAQRDSILKVQCAALWTDPAQDGVHLAWLRQFFRELYAETGGVPGLNVATDGMFINYADADARDPQLNASGIPWQRLYYKDNYPRLQQVKAVYDPRNVFRHGLSVELPV
ncbi:FAD-binding oxidoreductase [Kitasatospora sp. NPDC058032]|uniref:FAD-binding oxidoreductase n=1 Tax=Kitasatospora sp. NPDC058032 TaxID=3346307 RepID=UPI0036DA6C16